MLSVDKGSERFMSPMAQIVASETSLIDARQDLLTLERKLRQLDVSHAYFVRASEFLGKTHSGKKLFEYLVNSQEDIFKSIAANDDIAAEIVNDITLALETRRKNYFQDFRYISGPTLPDKKERKSRVLIVAGAGVGGLFFMSIFALLAIWWRQNKSQIIETDSSPDASP